MDSELLAGMFDYIAQENISLHSLLIIRNGYMVTEAYFYPYRQYSKHNLYSCTKSFTSALVGIAIGQGYIDGLDHRVLDFFSEHTFTNDDPRRQAMTLEHLLTMTSGLDWPEYSVSYSSSRNILMQMLQSGDWVQFALDRPMAAEPGTTFNYNTGASHLLSAIIRQATGMSTLSFARTHLFEPLDIFVSWRSDPKGTTFGGGGIWMAPRDMAKFGYLYLEDGVWEGQQVVPAEWVEASVTAPYYGYQWWILQNGAYAALGYKGQGIFVMPALEMAVVFTGALSDESTPSLLIDTFIIPAAKSSEPLPENPQGLALLESRINKAGLFKP